MSDKKNQHNTLRDIRMAPLKALLPFSMMGSLLLTPTVPAEAHEPVPSGNFASLKVEGDDGAALDNSETPIFTFPQNFEPPGDGRPDASRGSGARGGCDTDIAVAGEGEADAGADAISPSLQPMHALVPTDNFGLSSQSHPTVFINFEGHVAPLVVLRFEDEAGTYSERVSLPVDRDRSIQGFALPADRPPLEIGKNYRWTLLVACDGQVNPYHPFFSGWVQRAVVPALPQSPLATQIAGYTERGYWYDAVATLYQAIDDAPADVMIQSLWAQLLIYVEQGASSAAPSPTTPSSTVD